MKLDLKAPFAGIRVAILQPIKGMIDAGTVLKQQFDVLMS